ncbi:MAG: hypothetical protein QXV17_10435 [Candidatus Micrarchaeaceae archaeon]
MQKITDEQYTLASYYLQKFLKEVNITVDKNKVIMIQNYELPDEEIAKAFAKTLAKQFSGQNE